MLVVKDGKVIYCNDDAFELKTLDDSLWKSSRATIPQMATCFHAGLPFNENISFDVCLFLDFDGVLHPECCDEKTLFCFVPQFCEALRAVDPDGTIPIIISSMWRFDSSIATMRSHFPVDIARQIIGVTPDLSIPEGGGIGICVQAGMTRERECKTWMRQHAPGGEWLAIDDRASYFSNNCANLFLVPGKFQDEGYGLNDSVAVEFEDRLRTLVAESSTPALKTGQSEFFNS